MNVAGAAYGKHLGAVTGAARNIRYLLTFDALRRKTVTGQMLILNLWLRISQHNPLACEIHYFS
jgi:hypothetical protein